jgi:hypothetical protein
MFKHGLSSSPDSAHEFPQEKHTYSVLHVELTFINGENHS